MPAAVDIEGNKAAAINSGRNRWSNASSCILYIDGNKASAIMKQATNLKTKRNIQ